MAANNGCLKNIPVSAVKKYEKDMLSYMDINHKDLMKELQETQGKGSPTINFTVEELKKLGADAYYLSSFEEIEKFVLEKCIHGDVLITMGAGDVVNIGESLLK